MAELRQNTWSLNAWYEQDYAGNVDYESTLTEFFTWGLNHKGQNDHNSEAKYSSPTQVTGSTWAYLSNANNNDSYHMIATRTDGTLWSWGDNNNGQLGLNENGPSRKSSPVQIPGTTWNSGQLAREHTASFARKTDGTLWAWGYNAYGELGDNSTIPKSSPIQIPGSGWRTVAAGSGSVFATKVDNSLWSWGNGAHGALAHNNDTTISSPKQVGIAHDISTSYVYSTEPGHLAAGGQNFAVIRTDGSLWMCGVNEYGTFGNNAKAKRSSPIQVGESKDWSNVGMTQRSVAAIKTDGTLWVWGSNMEGRLGLNQSEPASAGNSSPTQIHGGGTTWETVIGGQTHLMATKKDGTLWTWGNGGNGMLGLNEGPGNNRSSPTQIPGTSWARGANKMASIYYGSGALKLQ